MRYGALTATPQATDRGERRLPYVENADQAVTEKPKI